MKRLSWSLTAFLVALAGPAGPARADVIFSNLGPGESYNQIQGYIEAGPEAAFPLTRQAMAFTAGQTPTSFDGARVALGLASGANEIDLRLYTDAGGQPGAVIETIHASGQMPTYGQFGSGHLVTFESALHPLLEAGGTYWLLPFASGDTFAGWNRNDQGSSGPFALSQELEPTGWVVSSQQQGAYAVNGTPSPAPEPSALALAGVGLVGLAGYAWRLPRRQK
jgi:hypothetical protein